MSRTIGALIAGLAFLFLGCQTQSGSESQTSSPIATSDQTESSTEIAENDSETTKNRGTIGFSALTTTNPFFVTIGDTMEAAAAKHGYNMIRVSGERDVNRQADQVDEFITKGVVAIVLNPCDSRSIGPAIKRANDAGIPVFTNDIKYDGDLGKVVNHVATDNYQGGRLAGQAMVDAIGKTGGKIGILHFPQVESCQLRVKGFNEIIDQHNATTEDNKIIVVAQPDGGGLRDEGYRAAKDIIQGDPDLVAIFAINDPSALGAYAALEEAQKVDQVVIIGFDGQEIGKKAILEGKILCDPIQFPDQIGAATIQAIVDYFDGEEVPPVQLIPSKLYYKSDAENDPLLKANK